jgi:purine-binding chemotaxis protein CheW
MDERMETNIGPDETTNAEPEAALDYPWVLFGVEGVTYGIYSTYVLSIEILGAVTPLVDTPAYMRGVTNFRGDMIQLIDLRSLFGLPNRAAELHRIIEPKLEAHHQWIAELRACVGENRPFTLAIDPHMCGFGQWYYSLESDNIVLMAHLKRIEKPHALLHQAGGEIVQAMGKGDAAEASRLLTEVVEPLYKETTSLLAETVAVFEEGNREMLLVLERDGVVKGMIVDDIVSVEFINDRLEMTTAQGARSQYVRNLGRRGQGGATVLMMNEETLFSV